MTHLNKIVCAAILSVGVAGVTATSAMSSDNATTVSGTQQTIDNKKKCKKGYRYSSSLKKCVKRAKRGSY